MGDRWSRAKAAQTAIDVQNACNLGGVTNAAHEIFRAFLDGGGDAANQSAPMRLIVHQIAFLSTGADLLGDDYPEVYAECVALAAGHD